MVVREQFVRIDSPAPRHAEMEDHRVTAIGLNQPIFGASAEPGDGRSGHPLGKIGRERPPEVAAMRDDARQPLALEDGLEAANGRFDFRKFRHITQLGWVCPRHKRPLEPRA
jgi:hypothetical protein